MSNPENHSAAVETLQAELSAVRARLAKSDRSGSGNDALTAYAMSQEIAELCRKAAICESGRRAQKILSDARHRLDELQRLLGLH